MRFLVVLLVYFIVCAISPARAQETAVSPPEITASGQDYLKAVRYRGIDTDVVYFDPTKPAPPLDTRFTPQPNTQDSSQTTLDQQWTVAIIAGLALICVIAFAYFGAGRTSVSFRKASDNARRQTGKSDPDQPDTNNALPDLDAILKQANRDLAVISLARLALARCLSANEVLFKRSWTHREALRSLPQTLWYIPDLRALVLESERVNFGHRSISETEFNDLLDRIRPVLSKVRA